jgi:hypothetical protein
MARVQDYHDLIDSIQGILATTAQQNAPQYLQNPELAEDLARQITNLFVAAENSDGAAPIPPDQGLAALAGVGSEAADALNSTRIPMGVLPFDETVTSERIIAVGDLYYLYNFEKIGVFHALLKLQDMFKSGSVRLSGGEGAFRLYQFDRRQVLRYTYRDRQQAYQRVFGYTKSAPFPGADSNREYHRLLVNFMSQVARYFRDKRISEVIRPQSDRGTFGSVAVVRRAGLDLRDNLKHASYGHVNVLRVEVMQLLEEAFDILEAEDVRRLFGADTAWDVVEEILHRYLHRPEIHASARSRMATAGRDVLRWLAQPHILNNSRIEFEVMLNDIADEAEEWLTSAESLGVARPQIVGPTRTRMSPLSASAATIPARSNGHAKAAQREYLGELGEEF